MNPTTSFALGLADLNRSSGRCSYIIFRAPVLVPVRPSLITMTVFWMMAATNMFLRQLRMPDYRAHAHQGSISETRSVFSSIDPRESVTLSFYY